MSSSVASGKVMERWAREREEAKNPRVQTKKDTQDNFNAMKPNFKELAKFEEQTERLVDRLEQRENRLEVEEVINVMGSTAGAGSGDFHTYRGYRTKEMARLKDFEEERKEAEAVEAWEKERAERAEEVSAKSAKRAAKRQRQKEAKKAKQGDEPAGARRAMPAAGYRKLSEEEGGKLGEGTFGVVAKAIKLDTGAVVAIKKLRRVGSSKTGMELPTLREIMLLQELQHENVTLLHEVYVHNGSLNLVFEYCVTDMERVINDKTMVLDAARIKRCMLGTLEGMKYCHASWVLHRDMKPGNLLLGPDGTVKLADFGLARVFGSPDRKYTGQVVTRWYRAPELLFGAKFYGSAVDLWSVGCIFAELMLRVPFFPGTSDIDQLARVFTALGTPTETDWPGLSSLPDYVPFQGVPGTPLREVFTAASPEALALLGKLLTFSPSTRISAAEALEHPYFTTELPPPSATQDVLPRREKA